MFKLWGREGNDKRMRSNAAPREDNIYKNVLERPPNSYMTELELYTMTKWRKGLLSSALGTTLTAASVGCFYGFWTWNTRFRHIPVHQAVAGSIGGFGTIAFGTVLVHHSLVMNNDYKQEEYHVVAGGAVGGLTFSMCLGNRGLVMPFIWTLTYTGYCIGSNVWERKSLANFLSTQQALETPIHKVTPELQPLYRAYLWEHKPLDAISDDLRNRGWERERSVLDARMDANAVMAAWNPKNWHMPEWIPEAPVWFPFKPVYRGSDFEMLQEKRMAEDNASRIYTMMREENGSFAKSMMSASSLNPKPYVDRDPSRSAGEQTKEHHWINNGKDQSNDWGQH